MLVLVQLLFWFFVRRDAGHFPYCACSVLSSRDVLLKYFECVLFKPVDVLELPLKFPDNKHFLGVWLHEEGVSKVIAEVLSLVPWQSECRKPAKVRVLSELALSHETLTFAVACIELSLRDALTTGVDQLRGVSFAAELHTGVRAPSRVAVAA